MLFYCEKQHSLYVAQQDWDDAATVMRVPVGAAGHVDGEEYETEYTTRTMHILATRAEMIDLDHEINVEDVQYRLDLTGLRIKHLAQAKTTTTQRSGKAQKGLLSWQTFRRYDYVGDIAFAWYELIVKSPDWPTLRKQPYMAPHDLDGALQMPDKPPAADADPSEQLSGTTNDSDPGLQASGATVDGDHLPAVARTVFESEIIPPCLAAAIEGDIAKARELQESIFYHAASFAASRIAYGLLLLRLKAAMKGAGYNWKAWYRDNIERPRFCYRSAAEYMQIARAFLERTQERELLTADGAHALLEVGVRDEIAASPERRDAFVATVAEVTTAQSYSQLQRDLGLVKEREDKGAGGYHAPRHLLDEFTRENGLASAVYLDWPAPTQAEFRRWRKTRERQVTEQLSPEDIREHHRRLLNEDLTRATMLLESLANRDWILLDEHTLRDRTYRIDAICKQIKHAIKGA